MNKYLNKTFMLLAALSIFAGSCAYAEVEGISKVVTENAPKALGPYSQAVRCGNYLFVSGQIAIDPALGKIADDTIAGQTKQVLNNIKAILIAEGLSFENVVKTEVYLQNMQDFAAMNTVYAEDFVAEVKPARQAMEVAKLPMNALVEISCIAFVP